MIHRALVSVAACLLALIGWAHSDAALAQKRVALLIGNGAYSNVTRLANPSNDVDAMAAMLRGAGFDTVLTGLDLDERGIRRALQNFEDAANGADIGLIFYSGHGIEVNGQNYLIPVDAKLGSDRAVDDEAVPLDRVLRSMEQVKRLRLVILDACRDNPFINAMTRSAAGRSIGRGLARVEPTSVDTLVAYAAKAGTTAADGDGRNSPFTSALLKHLATPGLDVRLALGLVRDDVIATTKSRQEPFVYGSLGGAVLPLARPAEAAPKPAATPGPAVAQPSDPCGPAASHWTEAKAFDRIEFYEEHVRLFGSCPFASFAKARIDTLRSQQANAGPAVLPPKPAPDPAPSAPATVTAVTECDRLAARRFDPQAKGTGIDMQEMDGTAALVACRIALAAAPAEPRFLFQAGRAYQKLKQYDEALNFYRDAADRGHAAAETALAFANAEGLGMAVNAREAERLYKSAAAKGDTQAMHNLGWMYESGRGVPRDTKEAARMVVSAIEKGNLASLEQITTNGQVWSADFRKEVQTLMKTRKIYAGAATGRFDEPTTKALRTLAGTP
ncbi:caspase family protein [uncultured Alsobacter sp.]|uniref:caspase family protein n=1 Tax=uncultured Alsobacter sp. TaxID=1748258 RepID=UPI0025D14713|nr:caspase family protein [uncultured Alsobacter sp.]